MRLIKCRNCFLFVVGSNYLFLNKGYGKWVLCQFLDFRESPADVDITPQEVLEEISLEELLALAENLC